MKPFQDWTCADLEAAFNELEAAWENRHVKGTMTAFFIAYWTEKSEKLSRELADMILVTPDALRLYYERKAEKKTIDKMLKSFGIASALDRETKAAQKARVTTHQNQVPVPLGQ